MKQKQKNANAPKIETKAQERLNMMVEVFGLEPSQYETAKNAIEYAVKEVADPENHEDAVIATAYDFLSGYECAQADYNRKRTNFMDVIETVMLCKGTRAALGFLGDFAEEGDADAAYFLAETYLKGDVCRQNEKKGAKYMSLAATLGNPEALVRIGSSGYCTRTEDEEEQAEIFEFFHKAALLRHPEAEMVLSILYHTGYGCEPNENLAHMWGLKANIDKCDHEKVLTIMGYDEE